MFETIINEIIQNENGCYEFKHLFKNGYPFLPDNVTLCNIVPESKLKILRKIFRFSKLSSLSRAKVKRKAIGFKFLQLNCWNITQAM